MKKIKNIVLGKDKKNFDISEVNICKRKSINNMIKNELENRSLSKSPNKFSFKPRKRKNDFGIDGIEKLWNGLEFELEFTMLHID